MASVTRTAPPTVRCPGCGDKYRPGRGCPRCRNAARPPRPRAERAPSGTFRCHECRVRKLLSQFAPTPSGSHRTSCIGCEKARDEARRRAEADQLAAARRESARQAEALARLKPTDAPPGSEAKLAVLCDRAERRVPLFHPRDRAWPAGWNAIVAYVRALDPRTEAVA